MGLLIDRGLPAEVLALPAGVPQRVLGASQGVLAELLGEDVEEVELIDDPEWAEFPEIGEAFKEAGGEEHSLCVAIAPTRCVWAVGIAGKKKVREPSARLALCAALAAEADAETFGDIAERWPEVAELCEAAGAVPQGYEPRQPPAKRHRGAAAAPSGRDAEANGGHGREAAAPRQTASPGLPRDVPLFIRLAEDAELPPILDQMPAEALVVSTDGSKRKGLYSRAEEALHKLLPALGISEEEVGSAVEYQDDANWEHFPEVGEALKRLAPAEECLCVAACPALGAWAVGVGMKGKARFGAAKAALVGALALAADEARVEVDLGEDLPSVADFVEEARRAREAFVAGEEDGAEEV